MPMCVSGAYKKLFCIKNHFAVGAKKQILIFSGQENQLLDTQLSTFHDPWYGNTWINDLSTQSFSNKKFLAIEGSNSRQLSGSWGWVL
jgi:hypothetical protein